MVPGLRFGYPVGEAPHHHDQLHLPVDHVARELDRVERAAQRRGVLREDGGDRREIHARLGGVARVVEADREHLARCGRRGAQRELVERLHVARCRAGPGTQLGPLLEPRRRVGAEASV